jgi:hypothetical protein
MRNPPVFANRRVYLQGLSAAAITTWLAGCGGSGSGGSGGGAAGPVIADTKITGSLNASQIGGTQLKVFSVIDGMVDVVSGSFTTKASEEVAQALLVTDGSQKLRAMFIHVAGRPMTADATSTALAIVFLTPGLSTLDKETARSRLQAIQAAPGFPAFLQLLQAAMPTQDLPTALAVPAIRAARDVVVGQVLAPIESRVLERAEKAVNQSQSDGYVVLKKDDTSSAIQLKIQLANEGYRFVKVVRKEDFNGQNQLAVPVLQGSPTGNSIIGGRGGASVATILSLFVGGQLGAPGGATDSIDQSQRKAERLTYYVRGLGNPLHASDESFPADVQSLMEAEGSLHLAMTAFFYFILPVIEPILYAFTGLKGEQALSVVGKALAPLFTTASAEAGFLSTATAGKAGDQAGFLLALSDLFIGLAPVILKALTGLISQLAPGALALEAALGLVGAAFATVNLGTAGVALFRTPQRANAELVLGAPIHFLDHLIAQDQGYGNTLVYLNADGSVIYGWIASAQDNFIRRINRLKVPPLGSPYQPEVTYDVSQDVRLIAANTNGEIAASVMTGSANGVTTNKFYLYSLPNGGSLNPVQIGQVSSPAQFSTTNPNTPGSDEAFEAFAISSRGDVAGTYREFKGWFKWDVNEYRPILLQQVWWIPKGGSLIKRDLNGALMAALTTAYPLGARLRGDTGSFKVFDLNFSGVLLIGFYSWVRDNATSQNFTEHVVATFNMVTGRINLLSRVLNAGIQNESTMVAGKINDKGQVALSRSEVGIFFGEFYNGAGATGEPIPTVIGFKNRFFVNALTSDGDVGGFIQILETPGVTGKAGIWKASGSGDVVDVHSELAGPTVTQPYSSSVARLGDDGTIVGRVITQRLSNPDLPAAFDNPNVDVARDFVIQGAAAK